MLSRNTWLLSLNHTAPWHTERGIQNHLTRRTIYMESKVSVWKQINYWKVYTQTISKQWPAMINFTFRISTKKYCPFSKISSPMRSWDIASGSAVIHKPWQPECGTLHFQIIIKHCQDIIPLVFTATLLLLVKQKPMRIFPPLFCSPCILWFYKSNHSKWYHDSNH